MLNKGAIIALLVDVYEKKTLTTIPFSLFQWSFIFQKKGQNASGSNSNDHEFYCHLHTEKEKDEDVNLLCQYSTKDLLKMLNLKSHTDNDYASMLRMCIQTDLSEQGMFIGIVQNIKNTVLS